VQGGEHGRVYEGPFPKARRLRAAVRGPRDEQDEASGVPEGELVERVEQVDQPLVRLDPPDQQEDHGVGGDAEFEPSLVAGHPRRVRPLVPRMRHAEQLLRGKVKPWGDEFPGPGAHHVDAVREAGHADAQLHVDVEIARLVREDVVHRPQDPRAALLQVVQRFQVGLAGYSRFVQVGALGGDHVEPVDMDDDLEPRAGQRLDECSGLFRSYTGTGASPAEGSSL